MRSTLPIVPATAYVDAVPATHSVLLVSVDEDLDSSVLQLTPAAAYKLAQMLIAAAESIELP